MSAYLDKAQGVTFVFSNIYDLYKKAKDAKIDAPFVVENRKPIQKSEEIKKEVKEFQPQELKAPRNEVPFAVPMGVHEAQEKAKNIRSLAGIKKNLSEISDAHARLRFLLQELESLTKKN